MAEKTFRVFEWKIKNFSYWCEAVHGECIVSPDFFYSLFGKVELYPRGDRMNVRFCNVECVCSGELSFIGFDGSSIGSQQVTITQKGKRVSGPYVDLKFEDVVAQIRKADRKDQITLRFCIQSGEYTEQHMCTTIGVWKGSFKIDPKLNVKSNVLKNILYFRYTSKKRKGMYLKIAQQDKIIQLTMEPNDKEEKAVLVESCISMLSSDNALVRNEELKHVFIDGEAWVFSESLTVKELEEKGIIILLGLKVINGEFVERYNHVIKDKIMSIVVQNKSAACHTSVTSSNQPSDDSVETLTKELMCLYQDQEFSDFQLKCGDVSFPVHRGILSARSPVFKTMLSSDMKEAASSEVDIEDMDPSTLSRFLAFLYTGAVEDLQGESARKLYYAADKYQVTTLKRDCADFLCAEVSISNVCDILSLANRHQDDQLTSVAQGFILKNYSEVLGSAEWRSLMRSESLLAVETLTHLAEHREREKRALPTSTGFSTQRPFDFGKISTSKDSFTPFSFNFGNSPTSETKKDLQSQTQPSTMTPFTFSIPEAQKRIYRRSKHRGKTSRKVPESSDCLSTLAESELQTQTQSSTGSSLNFGDSVPFLHQRRTQTSSSPT